MALRIDAHQHYWQVARGDYHWMPATGVLRRDYLPMQLQRELEHAEIDGTILVQAAQTERETAYLLALASAPSSKVSGVVGWVDLDAEAAASQLERLASSPKMVAVRPMLQDLADDTWITRPRVIENLRRVAALDLRFDILSYPRHLPYVVETLERIPQLRTVVDHLSKPNYRAAVDPLWADCLAALATNPKAYCKLSGMVTEVGSGWTPSDFEAHAYFIIDCFGPDRIMFGSDWPVCLQVARYDQVVNLAQRLTAGLSAHDQEGFWGGNAARFYGIE